MEAGHGCEYLEKKVVVVAAAVVVSNLARGGKGGGRVIKSFEPTPQVRKYPTRQKPVGKRPGKIFDFATFMMS